MLEIIFIIIISGLLAFSFFRQGWKNPVSTRADAKTLTGYETRPSIFVNASEKALFNVLERHKPAGYHVFSKVRLEDILRVRAGIVDKQTHWQYRGRIKSRHVDFTICDHDGAFICAIELDGNSHKSSQANMVDGFKDSIFTNAGLILYRVKTGENFDEWVTKMWSDI